MTHFRYILIPCLVLNLIACGSNQSSSQQKDVFGKTKSGTTKLIKSVSYNNEAYLCMQSCDGELGFFSNGNTKCNIDPMVVKLDTILNDPMRVAYISYFLPSLPMKGVISGGSRTNDSYLLELYEHVFSEQTEEIRKIAKNVCDEGTNLSDKQLFAALAPLQDKMNKIIESYVHKKIATIPVAKDEGVLASVDTPDHKISYRIAESKFYAKELGRDGLVFSQDFPFPKENGQKEVRKDAKLSPNGERVAFRYQRDLDGKKRDTKIILADTKTGKILYSEDEEVEWLKEEYGPFEFSGNGSILVHLKTIRNKDVKLFKTQAIVISATTGEKLSEYILENEWQNIFGDALFTKNNEVIYLGSDRSPKIFNVINGEKRALITTTLNFRDESDTLNFGPSYHAALTEDGKHSLHVRRPKGEGKQYLVTLDLSTGEQRACSNNGKNQKFIIGTSGDITMVYAEDSFEESVQFVNYKTGRVLASVGFDQLASGFRGFFYMQNSFLKENGDVQISLWLVGESTKDHPEPKSMVRFNLKDLIN